MSSYEKLIPPEIKNDAFAGELTHLVAETRPKVVVEIGSSSGEGSTQAIIRGALRVSTPPVVHCIEMSSVRFQALRKNTAAYGFVRCHNGTTVAPDAMDSPETIRRFYLTHIGANLRSHDQPLDTLLSWRRDSLQYCEQNQVPIVLPGIVEGEKSNWADSVVLIDGNPFTAWAELDAVYGANVIALDDINAYKCYYANRRLSGDANYVLYRRQDDDRYGFAIYVRKGVL